MYVFAAALSLTLLAPGTSERASGTTDTSRTRTLQFPSALLGNTRTLRVHLPPDYFLPGSESRAYPALVLNDGFAVFAPHLWNAPAIADSLVRTGRVTPFLLIGIDNAASIPGTTTPNLDRRREYHPYTDPLDPDITDPRGLVYADFVVREVLPFVRQQFRVRPGRAGITLGGASAGGIAALVTVLRHPDQVDGLYLESTPTFLFDGRLVREAEDLTPWPSRLYWGLGSAETTDTLVLRAASRMRETLPSVARRRAPGTRVLERVIEGASHTVQAWRDRLPTALQFLFPIR